MIDLHPTHEMYDSTKLSTSYDCMRWLFYEYVLGWRPDIPAHDLYFGQAYHIAREYQLLNNYDIFGAYNAFLEYYRKKFDEETDVVYRPKNPDAVLIALTKFAQERQSDLTENEILYTEISGTVPIDDKGRKLYYRMDSIVRNKQSGKIFSWDHKTASERSMNYRGWEPAFYVSVQTGTYTHCLYCMYPIEEVLGIEYCGTSFGYLKRDRVYRIGLKRVSAWKTPEQMNIWLWNTLDRVIEIEREYDRLSHCKDSDNVMQAFPINPNSCTKYWGCPYYDYCLAWPNPLRNSYDPPLGFKVEFWDPSKIETTNKKDLKWKN